MKIIICGNSFWSLKNFRSELITKLAKQNIIYFISSGPKDCFFKKINYSKCFNINFDNKFNYNIIFKELKNLIFLFYYYCKLKPDLVLNFNIKPVIYNTLVSFFFSKVKIINTITGSGRVFQKKNFFYKIISKIYILIVRKSNMIFFQNKYDKKLFNGFNPKLINKSLIVNGSGVNLSNYKIKNNIRYNSSFVFASRLMYIKGIVEYLKAAEIIKKLYGTKVKFYVAGTIKKNDKDYISEKELEYFQKKKIIKYLGFQSNIMKIFKKANCVILPTKLNEGVPRILIEAAASSKFLISSARPGCDMIVKNAYNGFLIKKINEKNLAKKIIEYLNLNNRKKKIFFKNSKKMSLKFDELDIVDKYLKQINIICN